MVDNRIGESVSRVWLGNSRWDLFARFRVWLELYFKWASFDQADKSPSTSDWRVCHLLFCFILFADESCFLLSRAWHDFSQGFDGYVALLFSNKIEYLWIFYGWFGEDQPFMGKVTILTWLFRVCYFFGCHNTKVYGLLLLLCPCSFCFLLFQFFLHVYAIEDNCLFNEEDCYGIVQTQQLGVVK